MDVMRKLRVAVLANPGIGEIFLRTLADYGLEPLCVVTDHPTYPATGSGLRPLLRHLLIRASRALPSSFVPDGYSTFRAAASLGWPVIPSSHLLRPKTLDQLGALDLDFLFVFSFSVLPPQVLEVAKGGCWSFHPSLLPKHRGPSPIHWIKQAGQTETGFSILQLDDGIDTGPILLQERVDTSPQEDADLLMWRLCSLGARSFARLIVATHYEKPPEAIAQTGDASYEKRPKAGSGCVDPNMTLADLSRTVRAWRARGGARYGGKAGSRTIIDFVVLKDDLPSTHHPDHAAFFTADKQAVLLILESS